MSLLLEIQNQTERIISELQWDESEITKFIQQANTAILKHTNTASNDELNYSLVTHDATYSGGFILFGGWTKIYDKTVPSGTRGHELYLAFGGLGAGGWKGNCDIELLTEGSFEHNGIRYAIPIHHEGNDDWEGYNRGFEWFYNNVKSFMFMYLPQFVQPIPIFVYFDRNSKRIGISVPNASLSCGIGGGTVTVKS